MKKTKFILPVILACIPFICSDGQINSRNLDIVFIGNSITQGDDPDKDSPPASTAEYIRTLTGMGSVRFLNRGRSGYTTVDFLPAAGGELLNAISAVKGFHTDKSRQLVFSISLGTNDSAEEGPKGSPLHPEEYHFNLKAITDRLLADFPGCIVVYQQPIWYSPNTYNFSRYLKAGLERLQSYFPELQSLVTEYSLTWPGQVFMGDTMAFGYFRDNYLTDLAPESGNAGTFYLHPNKKGTGALGRFWGDGIYEALLKKRAG